MKKCLVVFAFSLLLSFAVSANATSINFNNITTANGYTSPYAGVTVWNFDDPIPTGWSRTGGDIVTGDSNGFYSAPWFDNNLKDGIGIKDTTKYLTVPAPNSNVQTATIAFGSENNYLGLWWGSMDTYNTIEFYKGIALVGTFYGTTFSSGSGAQTIPETNKYVNLYGMPNFDSVKIISSQYAFELDNIAVGMNVVPEPSTILLIGLGLVGLAGYSRKLRK